MQIGNRFTNGLCRLGLDGGQYFLLIVDKDTEHLVHFNTQLRHDPVKLLEEYITITGHTPRFLRVDGTLEFVGTNIKKFCHTHNIILQIITNYNHTIQSHIENVTKALLE